MDEEIDFGDPLAWIRLDEALRRKPCAPDWLAEPELAIALCHRDGRIRETALQQAVGCPVLLPLVVVRCGDWVGEVRERARELLREVLDTDTAVALVPLVLVLGRPGARGLRRAGRDRAAAGRRERARRSG